MSRSNKVPYTFGKFLRECVNMYTPAEELLMWRSLVFVTATQTNKTAAQTALAAAGPEDPVQDLIKEFDESFAAYMYATALYEEAQQAVKESNPRTVIDNGNTDEEDWSIDTSENDN